MQRGACRKRQNAHKYWHGYWLSFRKLATKNRLNSKRLERCEKQKHKYMTGDQDAG